MEGFIVICLVVLGSVIAGVKLYRSAKGDIGCSCSNCGKKAHKADECDCASGDNSHQE